MGIVRLRNRTGTKRMEYSCEEEHGPDPSTTASHDRKSLGRCICLAFRGSSHKSVTRGNGTIVDTCGWYVDQ